MLLKTHNIRDRVQQKPQLLALNAHNKEEKFKTNDPCFKIKKIKKKNTISNDIFMNENKTMEKSKLVF